MNILLRVRVFGVILAVLPRPGGHIGRPLQFNLSLLSRLPSGLPICVAAMISRRS
jgi:hypothetical protein